MELNKVQESKVLKYLSVVLGIAALLILLSRFLSSPPPKAKMPILTEKSGIKEVDFNFLKGPLIKDFILFEKVQQPEEMGRTNPFSPVSAKAKSGGKSSGEQEKK